MTVEYVTLMGAEQVQSAGYAMKSAAEEFSRAVNNLDSHQLQHQRFMDDWLQRFETILADAFIVERTK